MKSARSFTTNIFRMLKVTGENVFHSIHTTWEYLPAPGRILLFVSVLIASPLEVAAQMGGDDCEEQQRTEFFNDPSGNSTYKLTAKDCFSYPDNIDRRMRSINPLLELECGANFLINEFVTDYIRVPGIGDDLKCSEGSLWRANISDADESFEDCIKRMYSHCEYIDWGAAGIGAGGAVAIIFFLALLYFCIKRQCQNDGNNNKISICDKIKDCVEKIPPRKYWFSMSSAWNELPDVSKSIFNKTHHGSRSNYSAINQDIELGDRAIVRP